MRRLTLGTAGHIDHGKTALIHALTGVDTDRLPDEKRRGITIDLGFARLPLDDGVDLGVVDVPGHEGLVRNMVAGATGIDLVLLVVAADEGVMPQTREHLAIIELLGIDIGVVAVTKTDLVDAAWLDLVVDDLRDRLAATRFAAAPIVPVSSETGSGLDRLRTEIARAAAGVRLREADDVFRLPVDRVFTVRGTGTVVTGTVWSGRLERDASVRVMPAGVAPRVRGLQVHGRGVDTVRAGERAAVALAGVDRDALGRGNVLVTDAGWSVTRMLTVRLRLLRESGWSISPRQRVRVHIGTAEVMARVVPLDGDGLAPGDAGWVQLRLEAPVVARAGDPFVIRSYSPLATIGGGRVAEPVPRKRKRLDDHGRAALAELLDGSPAAAARARAAMAGWRGVPAAALPLETPHRPARIDSVLADAGDAGLVLAGDLVFTRELADRARGRVLDAVDAFHARYPLRPGMDWQELRRAVPAYAAPAIGEHALESLLDRGVLERRADLVARAAFRPWPDDEQRRALDALRTTYAGAGLSPPSRDELPAPLAGRGDVDDLLVLLVYDGELVALEPDRFVARSVLDDAIRRVRAELGGRDGLRPTDFRAVFDVSRKYLIPLLAYLDRAGVTARRGDERHVTSAP